MESAIGFFDSGVGGISTLLAAREVLPRENFIYYADNAHAPFGNRSETEILQFTERAITELFVEHNAKAVVIACNTATGIGAGRLREHFRRDILGIEPALKPACSAWRDGIILCLTTCATAKSQAFNRLLMRVQGRSAVAVQTMPHLAETVEAHFGEEELLFRYLAGALADWRNVPVSAVVLGCTHYVFVQRQLERLFPGAAFFDGNAGTVQNLKTKLERGGLCNSAGEGAVKLILSDDTKRARYTEILRRYGCIVL